MALQYSVAVQTAQMATIPTTIGATPKLTLYTGTPPSTCALAATGSLLATLTNTTISASGITVAQTGVWNGTASAGGTIGYFRLCATDGTTCHMQGTVGVGSGDMSMTNNVVANTQAISVTQFTATAGNS